MTDAWIHDELAGWTPGLGHPATVLDRPQDVSGNALGIDVSNYQGAPNWAQVAASGRSFCYVKASESTNYVSPTLDAQYDGATAAGLAVGLYHFADPSASPEDNADVFATQVNRLGAVPGHLPPCLDLETGSGDLSGWAQRFITRLRAKTGCVRVMLYSSASFFKVSVGESWMDANIALWIASWGTVPGQPSYNSPRVAIHQYSDSGQVSGISGNVDLDYAIWNLNTIVPGATPPASRPADLTDAQNSALIGIYQQMSGSPTPGQWTGWPSWAGGSGRTLTMLDYLRQSDVLLNTLINKVNSLTPQSSNPSLSDVDVQRIATAVAAVLAQRLQS